MDKLIFFRRLVIICLALTLLYLYTSRQVPLNSMMKTSTTEESNTSLSQTKIYDKGNSHNQILFSTNKRKERQKFTKGLSEAGLSFVIKLPGKTNFTKNVNSTTASQWCDSCINYRQYKAVIYPKHIPDTYLDMVIFIPSQQGDTSFQRRQFLRKFPLNSTYFPQLKIRHVFVFGTCRNYNPTKIQEEAQIYDDIVIFDFLDTYVNLTIKTIVSLNWVLNAYNTDIFLKLDDDVLFSVTDVHRTLLKHLYNSKSKEPDNAIAGWCFYGAPVIRNLKHKWGLSKEVYGPSTYPPYCIGAGYALTRSAVSLLLNQTHNTPLIHLEDVSVGILAQKAGNIKVIDIPKWLFNWNWKVDNPKRYRKYNTIHTFQGEIDKLEELWKNIFL